MMENRLSSDCYTFFWNVLSNNLWVSDMSSSFSSSSYSPIFIGNKRISASPNFHYSSTKLSLYMDETFEKWKNFHYGNRSHEFQCKNHLTAVSSGNVILHILMFTSTIITLFAMNYWCVHFDKYNLYNTLF